jgi:protein TonB
MNSTVADAEFDFSFPADSPDKEISGSGSPKADASFDWSGLVSTRMKPAVADAEFDFSFPDGPADLEISGFRLSQVPILLEKKSWSSLASVILLHAALLCLFWIPPAPVAETPKSIEVQLVTMLGGPGLGPEGPQAPNEEPAAGPPPPASAPVPPPVPPAPVPEVKKEPPKLKQPPIKIARPAPQPRPGNEVKNVRQAPQTEAPATSSAGPEQAAGTGAGTGAVPGRGFPGQGTAGAGNGPGGTGAADVAFGSSDGPNFLRKALPSYPTLAKRLEKEGTVLLRVTIDEQGRPVEVEVLKKAGFGFDEEAVKAVKCSTFVPAKRNGKPLTCKALLPIRFVLKES